MKKPVMPSRDELRARADKAKNINISFTKRVPSAKSYAELGDKIFAWAQTKGCTMLNVKFISQWGDTYAKATRPETNEEKLKRITDAARGRHQQKQYDYAAWQRRQAQHNAMVNSARCCPSNCCCRKS